MQLKACRKLLKINFLWNILLKFRFDWQHRTRVQCHMNRVKRSWLSSVVRNKDHPSYVLGHCLGVLCAIELTHSMEHSPSREANWFSTSQEIQRILWNPKVHYAFTIARHLSLSWASSIQSISPNPTSWRSILILSSNLSPVLPSGLFPSGFLPPPPPKKPCIRLFSHPYALHAPPTSFFSILSPEQYWVRSTYRRSRSCSVADADQFLQICSY